ncbi:MAG: Smr/MutS family protein [Rhodospirillaceae bacterium]|nr:Smr/MutS family protein [Rhodospirillaceae bacterium]
MRKLTADEKRLWAFVTRSVAPLSPRHPAAEDERAPETQDPPRASSSTEVPQTLSRETRQAHTHTPQRPLHVGAAVDIDAATARKFKRGQMPCDAKLDLHGLTLAQAHGALIAFIRTQAERGSRSVLVITGKGSAAKDTGERQTGRIKAELIHWLNAAPLRPYILAVTEAPARQGGSGAAYVLLKRKERIRA